MTLFLVWYSILAYSLCVVSTIEKNGHAIIVANNVAGLTICLGCKMIPWTSEL